MKVLVTGASGLLGRAVLQRCKEDGHEVKGLALTRASDDLVKLDLTDSAAVEALLREYVPDVIIHTAAERRPDVVEKNPEASQAINVDVPAHLARFCAGIEPSPLLINISTDYVFDGSKPPYKVDDEPNPLNAYGVSKLQGERAVKEHGKAGSVTNLRVPVLYGKTLTDDESAVNILVDAIVPPSDPSKQKKMDHYAVRYPTNVSDVARALSDLAKLRSASPSKEVPDTLHFSAMEAMTKYDMCNVLARVRAAGPDSTTDYLIPEDTVDEQAATARPRHCKLELSVIRELGIDTTCVGFEDWWRAHLEEQAELRRVREAQEAAEAERLRIEREAEEEKRRAEEEKRRAEEEAAAEQRRQVEEAAAKKPKEEEEAAAEEQRKKDEEAEEERRKEEQEASAKAAEEEAVRREKLASEEPTRQKESSLDTEGAEPEAAKDAGRTGSADDALVSSTVTAVAETTNAPTASGPAEVGSSSPSALAPLMSPTSPNPSFSSLQASRPTPPATSGLPSPTSSLPPAGPHSIFASDADLVDTVDSTSATTGAGAGTPPASAPPHAETNGAPPLSHSSTEIVAPRETPLFGAGSTDHMPGSGFGAFRDQADYFPGSSSGANAEAAPNDADSDGYGQPSPRPGGGESASTFAGVSGTPSTISGFEAGYGEVPFGLPDQSSQHGAEGVWGPGSEAVVSSQPVIQTPHGSGTSQEAAPFVPPPQPQEPKRPSFTIRVGDPQKVGDPVTAHIVYTVRTQTDSTAFRAQQFSVLRRYRDFRWLHAALVSNNPGAVVPPVPEKVAIGRFAPELVEARRHGLETCIQKITNHALLYDDPDLKLFLESDNFAQDVKLRDMEKGPVPLPDGSTKYFATWGSSIHGPKFYEFDEWFDTQKAYLDSLESQLKQLVKAVSTVSSQRKDLAAATSEFSHTLTVLSGSSLSRSLSTCFAGLGELEVRAKELTDAQAEADVRQIGNIMYEYERVVGSVRKAFGTRLNAWQNWHKTDEEARKLRSKHEKLKREGRVHPDRLHFSLQEIADAEGKALSLKRDFDNISMLCKAEMARFDKERVDDIRKAVEGWLDGMVTRQQELIGEWEHYMDLLNRQTGMNPQTGAQSNAARPASQGTAPQTTISFRQSALQGSKRRRYEDSDSGFDGDDNGSEENFGYRNTRLDNSRPIEDTIWVCEECDLDFYVLEDYECHRGFDHFKCRTCEQDCAKPSAIKRNRYGRVEFECAECGMSFGEDYEHDDHFGNDHIDCTFCANSLKRIDKNALVHGDTDCVQVGAIEKLIDDNYHTWKLGMDKLLRKRGASLPGAVWDPKWDNDMVTRNTIIVSLGDDELEHIKDFQTAKDMWDTNKGRHQSSDLLSQVISSRKYFSTCDIDHYETARDYINRRTRSANELRATGVTLSDHEFAVHLLTGLPRSYDAFIRIVSQNLTPLNSTKVTDALLTEDKKRRAQIRSDDGRDGRLVPSFQIPQGMAQW